MALLRKVFGFYLSALIRSGHPEVLQGCRRANRETSAQSLRISASFLLRLQPLICCSHANASSLVGNSSTGSLVEVWPAISPALCLAIRSSRLSVCPV